MTKIETNLATEDDYRTLSAVEVAYAIENAVRDSAGASGGTLYGFGNGRDLELIGTATPRDRDDTSPGAYRAEIVIGNERVTRRFAVIVVEVENEIASADRGGYEEAYVSYERLTIGLDGEADPYRV
jgi:hypothetical protein